MDLANDAEGSWAKMKAQFF
jgi:hypothetical protein